MSGLLATTAPAAYNTANTPSKGPSEKQLRPLSATPSSGTTAEEEEEEEDSLLFRAPAIYSSIDRQTCREVAAFTTSQ
jgi:hypothetical protein